MGVNPKGRDWSGVANWDSLAKFYAALAIAWTVILFAGIGWLIRHRQVPSIKIRNVPLAIAATTTLHFYLIIVLLVYTINGHFPCYAEFWIMSIYLPFGIALFQANFAQLHSISSQQKRLLSGQPLRSQKQNGPDSHRKRGFLPRWRVLTTVRKTYVLIGIGMAIQLIITVALYATTPTLQGEWAVYGNIPHAKGQAKCRTSPQWIPSSFWQLFWAWICGPFILYRIRNIHDVHNWRPQLTVCILASLPGTPMWLTALYSPAFDAINKYWVPPMWLAPGIMVMQAVTILCPLYEAYRSRAQIRTTLNIIQSWDEKRRRYGGKLDSGSSNRPSYDAKSVTSTVSSYRSKEMYTMHALEKALEVNHGPLLQFAATKDFSGENIVFLIQVRDWRAAWARTCRHDNAITESARARLFNSAVGIYKSSVDLKTAEFPVNIESKIYAGLHAMFGGALPESKIGHGTEEKVVNPFADPSSIELATTPTIVPHTEREASTDSASIFWHDRQNADEKINFATHPAVQPLGKSRAIIRADFDQHAFDAAERSIKYLVLTNTWQKFVDLSKELVTGSA